MINARLINHIKSNKWILLAALFFIAWKFFLLNTQFKNGLDQARFNDSVVYIAHIESIKNCDGIIFCENFTHSFEGYFGFEHLTYRLFWGGMAHVFNIDSDKMYIYSFYFGIIIFVLVLTMFLKSIEINNNLIAFSLFFLSLYNGAGSYHGFFWIVPSFFALMFYLLILSILFNETEKKNLLIFIIAPLALYTHTISLYFILSTIPFYFIYVIFTKKLHAPILKKIIFLMAVVALFYIPTSSYLNLKAAKYGGNPYGIETFISQTNITSTQTIKIFPGFSQINTDYINWIFPSIFGVLVLLIILLLLVYYEKFILLALYVSAFFFTLISTININAVRFLLLLWPLTFLIYAYGTWFGFKFIKEKVKNKIIASIFYTALISCLIIFSGINLTYSYLFAKEIPISFQQLIKEL